MKLSCGSCRQQVVLDDSKVPSGVFKIKCPKCGKIITGQRDASPPAPPPATPAVSAADELQEAYAAAAPPPPAPPGAPDDSGTGDSASGTEDLVKEELARFRKEIKGSLQSLFGSAIKWHEPDDEDDADEQFGRKALVCEDDQHYIDIISGVIKRLGYTLDVARSTAEAVKKIDTGFYDLITVDYAFPDDKDGGSKILGKINGKKPQERRQTFAVLISANVKSSDANAAFFHGANITVNKEEIQALEHHIRDGQRKFREIYHVLNRILEEKSAKI